MTPLEIVTGLEAGRACRFTPLPLEGFDGNRGLFVPIVRYGGPDSYLWQYDGMTVPEGMPSETLFIGAGIMRDCSYGSSMHGLKMLELVAFPKEPSCSPNGEDILLMGDSRGGIVQTGKMPLLSDMSQLHASISKRYNTYPMRIADLIPAPSREYMRSFFVENRARGGGIPIV